LVRLPTSAWSCARTDPGACSEPEGLGGIEMLADQLRFTLARCRAEIFFARGEIFKAKRLGRI
jgi:hypothetical protein